MKDTIKRHLDTSNALEQVRQFWNNAPLWTDESIFKTGTRDFFEEHRVVVRDDCFAGKIDDKIFPNIPETSSILDLGCGIGFWLVEYTDRGFINVQGADLSINSLKIAKQRCESYDLNVKLSCQNAELTDFKSEKFDHVNCQGVIHHTPSPKNAVKEISRILKPGSTASISVYYKNIIIRNWYIFQKLSQFLGRIGAGLKGRGRESIYTEKNIEDIVRQYDGADNPIGIAYDKREFESLVNEHFEIEKIYYHFFPARSLPIWIPKWMHRIFDQKLPFMIYANLRKR